MVKWWCEKSYEIEPQAKKHHGPYQREWIKTVNAWSGLLKMGHLKVMRIWP